MCVLRLLVLLSALPFAAAAQPLSEGQAAGQLFSPRGITVAVSRQISEQEQAIVRAMFDPAVLRQAGQSFTPVYYGSVAWSPDQGLQSEALQGAYNFHSTQASDAAALAACNAVRASGTRPCAIAGQILPRGYEPRPLTLSAAATSAFRSTYRPAAAPKAFAVSGRTGAFSIALGSDAGETALADCNRKAQAMNAPADCEVVIAD